MIIQPGTDIGRYHILDQLGEGGMAVVYKAYDTKVDREVALKVIRTELKDREKFLKRFQREAKALTKLTHPNIVGLIDFDIYEGNPYIVMQYIPGGNLKERLTGPIPWQQAAALLAPIADALGYAHQQGILHRDVKPSNILITESGQPMLSDFGVARILEVEETMDLTATGMGVGTPEYMAPEQFISRDYDQRVDVYALGVVLYEMVVGRKPFTADTPYAVAIKQSKDPLPRPRDFVKEIPDKVERVIIKALAKEPVHRYKDMGTMAVEMRRIANMRTEEEQRADEKERQRRDLIARQRAEEQKRKQSEQAKKAALLAVKERKQQEKARKKAQARVSTQKKAAKEKKPKPPLDKKRVIIVGGLIVLVLGISGFLILGKDTRKDPQVNTLADVNLTPNAVEVAEEAATGFPTVVPTVTPTLTIAPNPSQNVTFQPLEEPSGNEIVWEGYRTEPIKNEGYFNLIASRAVFTPPNDFRVELVFDDVPEVLELNGDDPSDVIGWEIDLDIDNDLNTGNQGDGVDYQMLGIIFPDPGKQQIIDLKSPSRYYLYGDVKKYSQDPVGLNWVRNQEYSAFSPQENTLTIDFRLSVINPNTKIVIFPFRYFKNDTSKDLSFLKMELVRVTTSTISDGVESPIISPVDGIVMVHVPAGEFEMGSEDGESDESPVHSVYLDAFWIDQTEVTNTMYQKCVNDGICNEPLYTGFFHDINLSDHPVVYVSWYDAKDYCEWAGKRLPTEAEWEKAARGIDGRTYPWGEGISCNQANFFGCTEFDYITSPVGYYGEAGASPYGIYDMAGNAWEWVEDWFDKNYYQTSEYMNPSNTNSSTYKVYRGGSFNSIDQFTRSTYRPSSIPTSTYAFLGFRCAMDAE